MQGLTVPQSSTTGPGSTGGGFLAGLGDVFTTGVSKYLDVRAAEKMAEITGEAQLNNNYAIERRTNVGAVPERVAQDSGESSSDENQLIGGIDNKMLLIGGAGLLAALMIFTRS